MEKNIDHCSAKRRKTVHEPNCYSTFESLSGELILELFEYLNTKEIQQSFLNLNTFINLCIFDQRQQLHVHLDREISSFSSNYSPEKVISLRIEYIIISIDQFPNLKSLYIIHDTEREDDCLNMIKQIFKLSQLVNFTLSLAGSTLTQVGHKMIGTSFCHPSLQRIILSNTNRPRFSSPETIQPIKLIFPSTKFVYVSDGFHGDHRHHIRYKVGNSVPIRLAPQYHVRSLDLDFNNWRVHLLEELLSSLPLLIKLKVEGCGQTHGWFIVSIWENMLQNLKALQHVDIDIYIYYPSREGTQKRIQKFNANVAQKTEACKRINLTLGIRDKPRGRGCFQFSALLNMN